MPYEPTVWQDGDIVTSVNLNKIEQGILDLSNSKGTADNLLDNATIEDAGKILSIDDSGHAALTPGAAMYGSPLLAATTSDMTDTDRIYVYSGNEAGYTNGNWYYYDGTTWQSGGIYNSRADVIEEVIENSNSIPTSGAIYNKFQDFIDLIYPIGSLYFSTSSINPGTYLGGYWIRYAEGKTIFGASETDVDFTNETSGGSKTTAYAVGGPNGHNHVAGTDNSASPATRFIFSSDNLTPRHYQLPHDSTARYIIPTIYKDRAEDLTEFDGWASTAYTDNNLGNYVEGYGSVFTATNLPPYVTCYIWMRVAYDPATIVAPTNTYPIENVASYYRTRVQAVAAEINVLTANSDTWSHFVFITDMHANNSASNPTNYNHSQAIAMYLVANTPADKIILGGDYCDGSWKSQTYQSYANYFKEGGYAEYVYPLSGNHERMLEKVFDKDQKGYPDSGFAGATARACLCNDFLLNKTNIEGNIHEGYYYIDDESQKIRFLFLNTSDVAKYVVSDEQMRWLSTKGLTGKDGTWTLVVFGHANLIPGATMGASWSNAPENERNGADVEKLLRKWTGPVAGYICGHQHMDSIYINRDLYHVTLYCDKFVASGASEPYPNYKPATRVRNSNTDSAVTVISINPSERAVQLRRIGAGAGDFSNGRQMVTYQYKQSVPL